MQNDELKSLMLADTAIGDDPDWIIPPRYSWPLVCSAFMFLALAIVSLVYAERFDWLALYPVVGLSFALFITTVWHWHKPRFSTLIRRVDYLTVLANVGYASYFATTLSREFEVLWFSGLAAVAAIFATNEYAYYQQTCVAIDGSVAKQAAYASEEQGASCLAPTKPNTPARARVYVRTVFVHLFGVHVLAASLALALIVGGARDRE